MQKMTRWLLQEQQQCSKVTHWNRQLDFISCSRWNRSLHCISKLNTILFQDSPLSKIIYSTSSEPSYIVKNILASVLAEKKVTALVFPWSVTFIHCMRTDWWQFLSSSKIIKIGMMVSHFLCLKTSYISYTICFLIWT